MARLVTWNCNMAFREKKDRVLQYDPDLLVVQECESPDVKGDWAEFSDWLWIGENEHKGLGVFSRNGISLESAEVEGMGGKFTLPVVTDSSVDLLGIWAMNDTQDPENRYIGQVYTTLREYRDFIGSDTVVAGDFNWNVIWDETPNSPLCGNFSDTVHILNDCGLRSSYHLVSSDEFGNEARSTFFMHKKRDREYHTDYLFAPDSAGSTVRDVSIGEYDDWIDVSDHMPVVVDVDRASA